MDQAGIAYVSLFWEPPVPGIFRRLDILVDDAVAGSMRPLQFKKVVAAPGAHRLAVREGKACSEEIAIMLNPGQTRFFKCRYKEGIGSSADALQRLLKPIGALVLEEFVPRG